ncbi:MAG: SIS domain-containing protein [Solirubrobacteraceae bacterium]
MTVLLGHELTEFDACGAGHTAAEIAQQPDLWLEIAASAGAFGDSEGGFLRSVLQRAGLRILLTGAGSSAFAGQVLAPVLARRLRRRVEAISTTAIVASPREALAEDVPTLLVSFARSGDSPESVAAIELAEQCLSECFHVIVTCNHDGRLVHGRAADDRTRVLLLPAAANDRGFAMTSSFTGMVLAGRMILDDGFDEHAVRRLADAARRVLDERTAEIAEIAARGYSRVVCLGSGALRGLAAESALKVLELTAGGVVATSESALGFRHGPKAVLDGRTLALVYVSNDPYTRRYDRDILTELRHSISAEDLVAVAAGDVDPAAGETVWPLAGLREVDDGALALPAVLHAQLIALSLSMRMGLTPDNPFPTGEVNRVVEGVTIHPLS